MSYFSAEFYVSFRSIDTLIHERIVGYNEFILHRVHDINFMKEDLLYSWEYQGSFFIVFVHRSRFGMGIKVW